MASAVRAAHSMLDYGEHGDDEARLALAYAADVASELSGRSAGREADWGIERGAFDGIAAEVAAGRDPAFLAAQMEACRAVVTADYPDAGFAAG